MDVPKDSSESLIELARIIVSEQSLDATLAQVLDLACRTLAGADLGGVTLLGREGPTTAVATSNEARRVDAMQYEAEGGGPCLDAYRQRQLLRVDSTLTERRWPSFCRAASAVGILSTLSLPLVVAGDGLGALNLYGRQPAAFGEAEEAVGSSLAAHASVALANAQIYWRTQRLAAELEEALSTRGVIEQAKGILMSEEGCSADEAFDILVRASQRSHTKLHEVARRLVEQARERARRVSVAHGGPPPPE